MKDSNTTVIYFLIRPIPVKVWDDRIEKNRCSVVLF